jgi:phosphate transport system ATP-binding protein
MPPWKQGTATRSAHDPTARAERRPPRRRRASKLQIRNLNFYYGGFHALKNVTHGHPERKVTAFIGPSGCGKSTLLRTFNRMYSLTRPARRGRDPHGRRNLLTTKQDVSLIRAQDRHGVPEADAVPMSIYDNIAFGVRLFEDCASARWTSASSGRSAARRSGTRSRTSCAERPEPVRRPAAAAVHRARHRDQARGAAARRAVLGARPDLDREVEELIHELKTDYTS